MLTYLHPSNQGPDVGKLKSEFLSDFSLVSRTTCIRLDVVTIEIVIDFNL